MTEQDDPRRHSHLDDLRVDPAALQGDPFARKSSFLSSLLSTGRGWTAAVIAIGVLLLAWQFRVPVSNQVTGAVEPAATDGAPPVQRAAPTERAITTRAVTQLRAADPAALKQQIVGDLRSVGIDAIGYDRLGLSGVDARLPDPAPEAVKAMLAKHGISPPPAGILRIEILPEETSP